MLRIRMHRKDIIAQQLQWWLQRYMSGALTGHQLDGNSWADGLCLSFFLFSSRYWPADLLADPQDFGLLQSQLLLLLPLLVVPPD